MDIIPQPETATPPNASYWGVIPAPVRYCKALQPAAKLLFSEISALCDRKGYCWATNAHFQALYEVERYTVQRWLAALVREGFIRIKLGPKPGERRIFCLISIPPQKRGGRVAKKWLPRHKKVQNPPQKSGTELYNELEKEKEKESYAYAGAKFVGPGPVAARELQAQEEKVTASPSTVKSNSGSGLPSAAKLRNVERVVALVRDVKARKELELLWDRVHAAGRPEAWAEAVRQLKELSGGSDRPSSQLLETFVIICENNAGLLA